MTLTFRWPWHLTMFLSNYIICVKIWIFVITLWLVNGFISYSHTMLLRSTFSHFLALWDWPSDDFYIQHCSSTICVQKFCFSITTFSLVERFTSYSHTMLLWSRPLHWYAILWPSNGRKTFICVEKIWKPGFNARSAFPCYWCQLCIVQANETLGTHMQWYIKYFVLELVFVYQLKWPFIYNQWIIVRRNNIIDCLNYANQSIKPHNHNMLWNNIKNY